MSDDPTACPERPMFYATAVSAILIGVTLACGGGSDAGSTSEGSAAGTTRAVSAADLPDPCGLVTDAEVSDLQIELLKNAVARLK